jgi:hypothetical protein
LDFQIYSKYFQAFPNPTLRISHEYQTVKRKKLKSRSFFEPSTKNFSPIAPVARAAPLSFPTQQQPTRCSGNAGMSRKCFAKTETSSGRVALPNMGIAWRGTTESTSPHCLHGGAARGRHSKSRIAVRRPPISSQLADCVNLSAMATSLRLVLEFECLSRTMASMQSMSACRRRSRASQPTFRPPA